MADANNRATNRPVRWDKDSGFWSISDEERLIELKKWRKDKEERVERKKAEYLQFLADKKAGVLPLYEDARTGRTYG